MRRAKRDAQLAAKQSARSYAESLGVTKSVPPIPIDEPETEAGKPTPINLELARREAPAIAKHIRAKGRLYSHQSLRDFQAHAGILADGKYGPRSQSALEHFGVTNPPAPVFPGPAVQYTPPETE